jgi:hypothetical protein
VSLPLRENENQKSRQAFIQHNLRTPYSRFPETREPSSIYKQGRERWEAQASHLSMYQCISKVPIRYIKLVKRLIGSKSTLPCSLGPFVALQHASYSSLTDLPLALDNTEPYLAIRELYKNKSTRGSKGQSGNEGN